MTRPVRAVRADLCCLLLRRFVSLDVGYLLGPNNTLRPLEAGGAQLERASGSDRVAAGGNTMVRRTMSLMMDLFFAAYVTLGFFQGT